MNKETKWHQNVWFVLFLLIRMTAKMLQTVRTSLDTANANLHL